MFCEASEAAEKALDGDPKSVKARYRRAMARKKMEMWRAAAIDFRVVLRLDPRYQEVKKELAYVEKCHRENLFLEDEDPFESSDCELGGNGKPCKYYNHTECTKGRACPFSHAPDNQSERDALGRNVCRYYLMGVCRFGERCSYLHSKEFLLQKGWWSTVEGIDKAKKIYEVQQKFKRAAIDYKRSSNPEIGRAPKQKRSRGKKKSAHPARPDSRRPPFEITAAAAGDQFIQAGSGQSSRPTNSIGRTTYTFNHALGPEDDESDDEYEYGMFGFTSSEVEELLCHGIKPWGDYQEED
ncbi:hypothetical protein OG21DRAFT_1254691 [Imleria badia]|nr:hypothetical protein OG21DRAFT_1254691 [Imleria badia]